MAEIQKDIELKQGMSKATQIIAVLVLLIAASAGGYWWSAHSTAPADEIVLYTKAAPIYYEVAIVHDLLMLFYSQNYDDLSTTEGTQALQQASLNTINEFLTRQNASSGNLEAVYFTSLVMQ